MEPVNVPSIPAASFPLPPRLEGLRRLAYNYHWAWHPRTRNLWSLIDRAAWNRYRNPIPVISGPTDWTRVLDDEKFIAEYHDTLAAFDDYMANGSDKWFGRKHAESLDGPIAYFCAEYGIHESLGIYSGGLGRPRRRPHEVRERHGPAVHRCRAPVSQGLLPPADRCGRPSGAQLPRLRPQPRAVVAGPGPQRPAADRDRRAAGPGPVGRGLDGPGGPGAGPVAGHGCGGERGRGPADHPHPVRPRPGDAPPPGARAGHRRRPRDPRAGPVPGRLAPQRRPLGVPPRRARARARRERPFPRGCLGQGPPQQRVHDPHAGLGRQRAVRRRPRSSRRRPAPGWRRRADRTGPGPGPRHGR